MVWGKQLYKYIFENKIFTKVNYQKESDTMCKYLKQHPLKTAIHSDKISLILGKNDCFIEILKMFPNFAFMHYYENILPHVKVSFVLSSSISVSFF